LEPVLRRLARELGRKAPARPPILLPVRINKQRGLTRDYNQRSRSFLLTSLGATRSRRCSG
jgi:hypothetical protein